MCSVWQIRECTADKWWTLIFVACSIFNFGMKVNNILSCISRQIVRPRKVIITQCSLENTCSFGSSVRSVCTRNWLNFHDGTQNDKGLERLSCEEGLRALLLFSLVKRWLWRSLTAAWSYLEKTMQKGNEQIVGGMVGKDFNVRSGPQVSGLGGRRQSMHLYRPNYVYVVLRLLPKSVTVMFWGEDSWGTTPGNFCECPTVLMYDWMCQILPGQILYWKEFH